MKKQLLIFNAVLVAAVLMIGAISCKKSSDETITFALSSLKAGSIDMNGATPPSNVPNNPTITAMFTVAVDAASVTSSTVKMYEDYDGVFVDLTLTVSGGTITIVPTNNLASGALYKLSFMGVKSSDGQVLADMDRSFSTEGVFVPSGVFAYYSFENNVNDQVGNLNPSATGIIDLSYEDSYTTAAGKCGHFNGTSTLVEIPNGDQLDNTNDFTLSFWVKADPTNHVDSNGNPKGHFVMGLGAFYGFQFEISGDYGSCKLAAAYNVGDTAYTTEDLWFNGDGKTGANGGWQGWTFCKDLTGSGGVAALLRGQWAFVTCVYESSTKVGTMYINGEKMKAQDFNLWPAGDKKLYVTGLKFVGQLPDVDNTFAFGFIKARPGTLWSTESWANYYSQYSNHFGGWLDDVRFFHKALTPTEVSLMYSSAKP